MTRPRRPTNTPPNQIASDQPVGGYLSIIHLPPLAALAISLGLALCALSALPNFYLLPANQSRGDASGSDGLAPLFTPEVQYWAAKIIAWGNEWGIDPNLVATVMQIESCGDPRAASSAGAMGLFQVMPFHFAAGEDPYDPQTNAWRGMAYLSKALSTLSGNPRLALAGYNGGISRATGAESDWPAETVRYAYWGTGIYNDAAAGKKHSPTLTEWLEKGGAGLCAQARQRLGITP